VQNWQANPYVLCTLLLSCMPSPYSPPWELILETVHALLSSSSSSSFPLLLWVLLLLLVLPVQLAHKVQQRGVTEHILVSRLHHAHALAPHVGHKRSTVHSLQPWWH